MVSVNLPKIFIPSLTRGLGLSDNADVIAHLKALTGADWDGNLKPSSKRSAADSSSGGAAKRSRATAGDIDIDIKALTADASLESVSSC